MDNPPYDDNIYWNPKTQGELFLKKIYQTAQSVLHQLYTFSHRIHIEMLSILASCYRILRVEWGAALEIIMFSCQMHKRGSIFYIHVALNAEIDDGYYNKTN